MAILKQRRIQHCKKRMYVHPSQRHHIILGETESRQEGLDRMAIWLAVTMIIGERTDAASDNSASKTPYLKLTKERSRGWQNQNNATGGSA